MLFRNAASWRTREYENLAVFRNVMSLGGRKWAGLEDVAGNDMGCFRYAVGPRGVEEEEVPRAVVKISEAIVS